MSFFSILAVSLVSLFSLSTHAAPPNWHHPSTSQKTLYFLDNNPDGSSVVAVPIANIDSHTASKAVRTSTNGIGAVGLTSPAFYGPGSAGPDGLYSQHALLFTLNVASHTLVMFSINPLDPLHPTLVGEPVDTLGTFPVAVAYSDVLRTACVLNGGGDGGVACFDVNPFRGLTAIDKKPRSLAPALNQSTPAAGPVNTASDIIFSPSSKFLIATQKGNVTTPPDRGSISAWPVVRGIVSDKAVVTTIDDMPMEFGFSFLGDDSRMLVSDVSFGGSLVYVNEDLKVKETAHFKLPTFILPCWTEWSEELNTAYIVDAASPQIAAINLADSTLAGLIQLNSSIIGAFDTVRDGTTLYSLVATPDIIVVQLEGGTTPGKQVQQIDMSSLGPRKGWQGLALYPVESQCTHY